MSRRRTTLWNFLFLNIRFVISMANGILIIPLYLYYIDKSLYGSWLATGNILTWITVVDPGVGDVLLQKVSYAYGKNDKSEVGKIISSSIAISLILFAIATVLGILCSFYISTIAKVPIQNREAIEASFRIALWGTTLILLTNTFTNICLAHQKTKQIGIILNAISIVSIGANLLMLFNNFGLYALAYSNLIRGLLSILIIGSFAITLIYRNKLSFSVSNKYIKSLSGLFAYTFAGRIVETIATNIDLLLVARFVGVDSVPMIDICRKPITIVSGLVNNVSISMLPTLPHLFGSKDKDRIDNVLSKFSYLIIWMPAFFASAFLIFNYAFVCNWVGANLWFGNLNNVLVCLYSYLLMIAYSLSNVTYSMGDIKNNSILNVIKSAIYLICLLTLGKLFGVTGVLISAIVAPIVMLFYFPKKIYRANIIYPSTLSIISKEFIKSTIFIAISIVISLLLQKQLSWLLFISFCLAFSLLFAVYIYLSKSVLIKELKTINNKA